jgi:tripartite-type tricarboxylate transporter receptor subunit TctC
LRSPGGADEVSLLETLALALNISIAEAREVIRIVPFASGSEQDAAVAGGHIHLTLQGFNESPGLIAAGEAIPLVILAEQRVGAFPNVPSTGELGIPSYIGTWRGIFARRGTPQAAINAMEKAIEYAWHTETFQTFAGAGGYLDRGGGFMGQDELKELMDSEYQAFEDFLVAAGLVTR